MINKYILIKNINNDLGDKYTDVLGIYSNTVQAAEHLKKLYASSIEEANKNGYRVSDTFIGSQNRYRSFCAEKETDAYEVSYQVRTVYEYEDDESSVVTHVEEAHIVYTTAYCGEFMCSHCNETFKSNRYKHCPWCGAKFNNSEELM